LYIKVENQKTPKKMYTPGDLIIFKITDKEFYGEIVGISDDNKVEVSRLKKTIKQEGRIWEFVDDDKWSAIDMKFITKHVHVPPGSNGHVVSKAWKSIGFLAGGDGMTFCRIEDEDSTTMPVMAYEIDSEDEDGSPSTNPSMHGYESDGFVVPDDEGEQFEFADPSILNEEDAEWVEQTHRAVREFDNWSPKDKAGKAIKKYIEKMDKKASIQTDNQRFSKGKSSISTSKPPLKRKRGRDE
jgi:hypothetical protein